MSFGRSQSAKIKAPPRITSTVFNSVTGDRFSTNVRRNQLSSSVDLSPETRGIVNNAQTGLLTLSSQLNKTDSERARDIRDRADDFYQLQAEGINRDANELYRQTESDLSKRFGGAFNASFGVQQLGNVRENQQAGLATARRHSSLAGEELYKQDEESRINRFNTFSSYLDNLNNLARGYSTLGTNLLERETQRASDIAVRQAELSQQSLNSSRANRSTILRSLIGGLPRFGSTGGSRSTGVSNIPRVIGPTI